MKLGAPPYQPPAPPSPAPPPFVVYVFLHAEYGEVYAYDFPRPLETGDGIEAYLTDDPDVRAAVEASVTSSSPTS